jgi:tRNA A-37 threonylcarbamoyl transferase component Bud32
MRTARIPKDLVSRAYVIASVQKKEYGKVVDTCGINRLEVGQLASKMGIRLPHNVKGQDNVCHILGVAMSLIFTRNARTYPYPVRVVGSGVAGIAMFMSNGTIIKLADLKPGKRAKTVLHRKTPPSIYSKRGSSSSSSSSSRSYSSSMQSGLASGGQSIPRAEFVHEIVMTRKAHSAFGNTPNIINHAILIGKGRSRIGVMQMNFMPGRTVSDEMMLRSVPSSRKVQIAANHGKILARVHARNWIHGDMHTNNVMVVPGTARLNVIDWARSNRKDLVVNHHPKGKAAGLKLWKRALINDLCFVYRDYINSYGKGYAEAMLNSYAAGAGKALRHVTTDMVRAHYQRLVMSNVQAMFGALTVVSKAMSKQG